MSAAVPQFPWEYLRQASAPGLQSFELTRLNHAAHLRKEITALLDQWLEETACALLARWLFDHQADLRAAPPVVEEPRALREVALYGEYGLLEGDPSRDPAPPLPPQRVAIGAAPLTDQRLR